MAGTEWMRTFLAVYRTGSVTAAARERRLTQPAVSQQLASLERICGRLFEREARGVTPTELGKELFGVVADHLDALEKVFRDLDVGAFEIPKGVLRFGSSREFFEFNVLPLLAASEVLISAQFEADPLLFRRLEEGELDVAVTCSTPTTRTVSATGIGVKRHILVAAPSVAPAEPLGSMEALGQWLCGRDWVSCSLELPLTRLFWLHTLGRSFQGHLRLVAPDLGTVRAAVEHGRGVSLLPRFVCQDALAAGRLVEVHPVSEIAPAESWYLCVRPIVASRPDVRRLLSILTASGPSKPAS